MNISPKPSSFAGSAGLRVDSMKMSPVPGGMNWLLDSGARKPSSSSLISNSGSSNNYYSISNHASTEKLRRSSSNVSTEMRPMRTSSILLPEMSSAEDRIQEEPLDVLSQTVQSCTSTIFGLYGMEIWKFDQSGSLVNVPIKSPNILDLRRQSSGIFIKRVTQEADSQSPHYNSAARDAFERLTDTTRLDYIYHKTTDPGVGIAGALWSAASTSNALAAVQHGVQSISSTIHRRVGLLAGLDPAVNHEKDNAKSVLWRDIDTLAEDPDQPYDERLQSFARAGFKLAAGVPFDVRGFKGIVIFYANPHADGRKLRCPANSELIQFAAQFIGSAAAIQAPLETAKLLNIRRPVLNWKRLRVKILSIVRLQRPLRVKRGRSQSYGSPTMRRVDSFRVGMRRVASFAMNREQSFKLLSEATTRLRNDIGKTVENVQYASKAKTMKWWQKVKGGHADIPPAFNTIACLWTFAGVSSTHAILSCLDYFIVSQSSGKFELKIAPLGALTTLQYNLTAAPASQPRNAFFSQVIALSTAYFLHQMNLDKWQRCAIAPAIVTTFTARLGIIHPPAGASAVVFSYEDHPGVDMILFLVGVAITIFTAVVINNLCDKRQYPSTKWAILDEMCYPPSPSDRV